jgi:hypothetical protein
MMKSEVSSLLPMFSDLQSAIRNLDRTKIAPEDINEPELITSKHLQVLQKFQRIIKSQYLKKYKQFPVPGTNKSLDMLKTYINICLKMRKRSLAAAVAQPETSRVSTVVDLSGGPPTKDDDSKTKPAETKQKSLPSNVTSSSKPDPHYMKPQSVVEPTVMENDLDSDEDHDYESASDEELDLEEFELAELDFPEFIKVIEKSIEDGVNRFLICAGGGRGKTTASKRLALQWALGECLKMFSIIIRLDLKAADLSKSLFDNILEQYTGVKAEMTESELNTLSEVFRFNQKQNLFLLDGLDESRSKS